MNLNQPVVSWLPSAGLAELVWTLLSLGGLWYGLRNLHDAYGDLAHLLLLQLNGSRQLVARSNARREWLRTIGCAVCVAIGLAALLTSHNALVGQFVLVGLLVLQLALTANSYLDRRQRIDLLALMAQEQDREQAATEFHSMRRRLADHVDEIERGRLRSAPTEMEMEMKEEGNSHA